MSHRILFLFALLSAFVCSGARAQGERLTIEITKGASGAMPIAVVPFGVEGGTPPQDVAQIVTDDLRRSARFDPLSVKDMTSQPHQTSEINFQEWRQLKSDSLVIGKIRQQGNVYTVQFQLFDVYRGTQLAGYSFRTSAKTLRRTAHQIADLIYETLTGEPGAFATRIAYVTVQSGASGAKRYSLIVADADGYNPFPVLKDSTQPILSPSWSPNGERLAYVSLENRRAEIYSQDMSSGRRGRIASFPGLNGAPAWSPDGGRLALTLSKDGNPEIYVMDLASKRLERLTNHPAIDTEPVWSPDGRSIIFMSDRGGGPQLYRMPSGGGSAQRLTFEGNYNASPAVSNDGKRIAFIHREGGRDRIAVMATSGGDMQVLTDGSLDESPSFAPNGSMIIYATRERGRGVLAAVSVDGRVRQRLSQEGDVREPAWAPFSDK